MFVHRIDICPTMIFPTVLTQLINTVFQTTPDCNHCCMTVSCSKLPESSKLTHIEQWFLPVAFTHWDFPRLPQSFYSVQCTVGGERLFQHSLQSCVEKYSFLTWLSVLSKSLDYPDLNPVENLRDVLEKTTRFDRIVSAQRNVCNCGRKWIWWHCISITKKYESVSFFCLFVVFWLVSLLLNVFFVLFIF